MSQPSVPRYVHIADEIRNSIKLGKRAVGSRLPPESQLAKQFEVNRHTLRQAIALLKQEGILEIKRGLGTFVAAAPIRYAIGKRVRFNQALKAQSQAVRFVLEAAIEVEANSAIADHLEISQGEKVALFKRLSYVDGIPLSLGSGFFPLSRFPNFLSAESIAHLKELGSISTWLRDRYGVDHIRRSTAVSARLVEPEDARLLKLPLNQPILQAESVNIDQYGKPIEYGVARLRGDRMELYFEN